MSSYTVIRKTKVNFIREHSSACHNRGLTRFYS